jgi:thiol-disulfide isomerase/thioredoxin
MRRFLIFSSLILIGFVFFSCKSKAQTSVQSNIDPIDKYLDSLRTVFIGKDFYNLVFTDSLNNTFDLNSLKGNVVAINIWTFGCKPCFEEMPKLNLLVEKYKKDPVRFI